jgi:hypothetical protein
MGIEISRQSMQEPSVGFGLLHSDASRAISVIDFGTVADGVDKSTLTRAASPSHARSLTYRSSPTTQSLCRNPQGE